MSRRFTKANICAPLNIKSMTFHLEKNLVIEARLAGTSMLTGAEDPFGLALNPNRKVEDTDSQWRPKVIEEDVGGAGLMCSAVDLQKIMLSLASDNGVLWKPATVLEMHKPQLTLEARRDLMKFREVPQQA